MLAQVSYSHRHVLLQFQQSHMTNRSSAHSPADAIELHTKLSKQQFSTIALQLLNDEAAFDWQSLYEAIMDKHGSVSGQDLLKVINVKKQQAEIRSKVDQQLNYYRATIEGLLQTGRNNLSMGEFILEFILCNPYLGIVTIEVQNRLHKYKIISLHKLMRLVEDSPLSIYKMETPEMEEINGECQFAVDGCPGLEAVHKMYQIAMNSHCFANTERDVIYALIENVRETIKDSQQKIEELSRTVHEQVKDQQEHYYKLHQLELLIGEKDSIINRICEEHYRLESEFQSWKHTKEENSQVENEQLLKQNQELAHLNQEMREQVRTLQYVRSLQQINFRQFETLDCQNHMTSSQNMQVKVESCRLAEQELQKQLTVVNSQVHKLMIQNMELKNKVTDLEEALDVAVASQFRKGERNSRPNVSNSIERLSSLSYEQVRDNFLQCLRMQSIQLQMSDDVSKNIYASKSTKLFRHTTRQFAPIEQTQQIHHQAETDESSIFRKRLLQFDFAGVLSSNIFGGLRAFLESSGSSAGNLKQIFSSRVQIVRPLGQRQAVVLIISNSKILFCKPHSLEVVHSFNLTELKQMIFCSNIGSMMVLVAKEYALQRSRNAMTTVVIQIFNRNELLNFISNSSILTSHSSLAISFSEADRIYVTQNSQQLSLQKLDETRNIVLASIDDGKNLFQANQITNFAFFTRKKRVFLAINTIGIILFEQAECRSLSKMSMDPKITFVLPFCKHLEVITLCQQNRIKLSYPSLLTSYTFEFESSSLVKLFEDKIKTMTEIKSDEQKRYQIKYATAPRPSEVDAKIDK